MEMAKGIETFEEGLQFYRDFVQRIREQPDETVTAENGYQKYVGGLVKVPDDFPVPEWVEEQNKKAVEEEDVYHDPDAWKRTFKSGDQVVKSTVMGEIAEESPGPVAEESTDEERKNGSLLEKQIAMLMACTRITREEAIAALRKGDYVLDAILEELIESFKIKETPPRRKTESLSDMSSGPAVASIHAIESTNQERKDGSLKNKEIDLVKSQTGATRDQAIKALRETDYDLVASIVMLSQ